MSYKMMQVAEMYATGVKPTGEAVLAAAHGSACAVEPVGVFINDEMQERGWSIEELVSRMDGDPVTHLTMELMIHAPTKGMTLGEKDASLLARAFGTSKELWLRLDAQWQKHTPNAPSSATADMNAPIVNPDVNGGSLERAC